MRLTRHNEKSAAGSETFNEGGDSCWMWSGADDARSSVKFLQSGCDILLVVIDVVLGAELCSEVLLASTSG